MFLRFSVCVYAMIIFLRSFCVFAAIDAFSDAYIINVAENNRPQTVNCCEFIPRPVTSGASFGWTHLINPELCIQISIMFVPPTHFGLAPPLVVVTYFSARTQKIHEQITVVNI